ncbi:POSSIBLE LINOLEOYL-CoA DESATURASE (DELTA(6)-DESATURASE) [hydrothermal vent metagenome]|uniref:POSSIBLE LINOLEOYL-CoA DESATURASE (DELTA(6)-DESATURASE) n=1 Tax=hydrothermal vent metagenome TaxID=652676 RepID=A0A1W1EHU3_9ZZZZ
MSEYVNYADVDKEALKKDIEDAKASIGNPSQEDFEHLLKMERWGRLFTFSGYGLLLLMSIIEVVMEGELSNILLWSMLIISSILIGIGNVGRWANVTHPILHGAYDKVPNIPQKYMKKYYANGSRRWLDWLDWIAPDAWSYEHNIMHHYHLGEADDPDNVERNMQWLIQSNTPMWLRRVFVYIFAGTWKFTYYAPNTLRILQNKKLKEENKKEINEYEFDPRTPFGFELWWNYYLPYGVVHFVVIPALFLPLGVDAVINALAVVIMAEYYANLHSFLVIVPNHSADDIYMFNEPYEGKGEFYLRQIMGSVNYNTGSDWKDFLHGFLNYQVEHHIFPDMPLSFYQKTQPIIKEICKKHNLEYRQESVWKRIGMTIDLMVGKTKLLRVNGI